MLLPLLDAWLGLFITSALTTNPHSHHNTHTQTTNKPKQKELKTMAKSNNNKSNYNFSDDDYTYSKNRMHIRCEECDRSIGGTPFYDEFNNALCPKCENASYAYLPLAA